MNFYDNTFFSLLIYVYCNNYMEYKTSSIEILEKKLNYGYDIGTFCLPSYK